MNQLPSDDTQITFIVAEKFQAWDFLHPRDRVVTKSILSLSDFVAPGASPISTIVGITDDGKCIVGAVIRRALAMPAWSDKLFVCVLMSDSDDKDLAGLGRFDLRFAVVYGARGAPEEEDAVGWDLVDACNVGSVREVLWACKPPVPCLRKAMEAEEGSSCRICLVEVGGGCGGFRQLRPCFPSSLHCELACQEPILLFASGSLVGFDGVASSCFFG